MWELVCGVAWLCNPCPACSPTAKAVGQVLVGPRQARRRVFTGVTLDRNVLASC